MIGFLKGKLLQKHPPFLLLDVQGVGYEIESPMTTFYALPDVPSEISLFVHLVVREDAHRLYGFSDQVQRELFRRFLKLNGIGPKIGLAILSTFNANEVIACIHREDVVQLTGVPGIGKKSAERMIIEMRDSIATLGKALGQTDHKAAIEVNQRPVQDAVEALISLGYKPSDANKAVRTVESDSNQLDELIRNALQHLTRR